jgi:hypothetical protein
MTVRELIEQTEMYEEDIKQTRIRMNTLQGNVYKNVLLLTDLNIEMWNDIKGYEGLYQISNFGNVMNVKTLRILKYTIDKDRCKRTIDKDRCKRIILSRSGKVKKFFIHRLIAINFTPNDRNKPFVDHIDNDTANNKISNLRWCTREENQKNRSMSINNTSGIKGVNFNKQSNKWHARIQINGNNIHLGYFMNIEDAKQARQKKALEMFGEFVNACEL